MALGQGNLAILPDGELARLYCAGMPAIQVATKFGVSINTVIRRLRKSGVPIRTGRDGGSSKKLRLTGQRFGRLTVLSENGRDSTGGVLWLCRCDCGETVTVRGGSLRSNHSKSCGCYALESKHKTHGMSGTREYAIWKRAKRRAMLDGIEFNISVGDIVIPEFCPVLGIPLVHTPRVFAWPQDGCPSIDRVDSSRGYVRRNVWIISWRANKLKSNATLEELKLLVAALERRGCAVPMEVLRAG